MWPNPQFPADFVTYTEEILNGKFQFLCSVNSVITQNSNYLPFRKDRNNQRCNQSTVKKFKTGRFAKIVNGYKPLIIYLSYL